MSRCRKFGLSGFFLGLAVSNAVLLLAAGPALAASKPVKEKAAAAKEPQDKAAPGRQAQEKAARKACLTGDYGKGVDLLADLFVETKDPTYVFNQGRCFEQNLRYEDAVGRFQEYLRAAGAKVSPEDKQAAENHIASCKELLAQERGRTAAQTAPAPSGSSPPAGGSQPLPAPLVIQPAAPPPPASSGAGLRVGGIVVASFGVAAAAAGVVASLKANSILDDMYATVDGYTKESDRKTYATLAWIGYGVGGACVVTGAILYTLGHRARSKSATGVALVPTIGPGNAGAALRGAF
jgi:hypothetical protein